MIYQLEFSLVKDGYGDLKTVRELSARDFIAAITYENYLSDYQQAWYFLNNKAGSNGN